MTVHGPFVDLGQLQDPIGHGRGVAIDLETEITHRLRWRRIVGRSHGSMISSSNGKVPSR